LKRENAKKMADLVNVKILEEITLEQAKIDAETY